MTQSEQSTRSKVERAGRRPPLVHQPHDGVVAQSFAQQRLWFLSQLDAGGTSYNAPFAVRLTGPLDANALRESFLAVVARHEVLRTTFGEEEGRPVQRIHPRAELEWGVEEVEAGAVRRRVEEEARRPFDLERGPLLRGRLLKVGKDDHVLVWVVHHIVFDGWSVGVLEKEVSEEYGAKVKGARKQEVQYADYARWQGEWLKGEVLETQLEWWKQAMADAPRMLELPADRARPAVQTFRGALKWMPLPEGLEGRLRELSRKEGVTLYMTLLAGFQALLARYSGQEDIVVGSPFAGRGQRDLEGLIGFFANMLALRTQVEDVSFQELCGRVRTTCLGAFAHQDVPFEQLVDALHLERDSSRSPLFQVAFVLQGEPSAALVLPGVEAADVRLEPGVSKFDLTLFARESARGLVTYWEFNTDLFDEETVSGWAEAYVRVLEAVVARPELRVSELPLVSESERERLLVAWNDTRTEYPRDASIQALFEAQAQLTPDAVAVEFEGSRLTFAELNQRANQLAHRLRRQGVESGSRVGLFTRRSLEMVVATLGILKAGGAYVPLDPSYPPERLSFMGEDAGLMALLVQPSLRSALPRFGVEVVELEPSWAAFSRESVENLTVDVPSLALAYVMYTSGSTGQPKGVCIPHRGVVRLVKGSRFVESGPGEVFLQLAPISFDAATLELWGPLLNGGKLVVYSEQAPTVEELEAALARHGVTALWLTAALFEQVMTTRPDALATVRQVLTGGDVVSPAAVRARLERGGRVVNGYGPTENTTFTTTQVLEELGQVGASVSIGRPIANTQVYVLDGSLSWVPVGVWGELYTGGDGLAWGYHRRPDLTAERFVPHPFSAEPGARLYRTGDRVRYRRDGTLEFASRWDGQVKLRGFRIELGEVEAALAMHPGVREVSVLAREDGPGGRWLVAYFVPSEGAGVTVPDLRAHARERLPEYMVPSAFVSLPVLPLTPNGKLDRKALPSPRAEASREGYSAPRTAMEQVVAEVLAPLLGLERMGRDDHFFELGGHSLLATRAVSRLREGIGRELPVRVLFESPTVAGLAERLEESHGAQPPPLTHRPHSGVVEQSFAQQRVWLTSQLDTDGASYNVPFARRLKGPLNTGALRESFREVVRRHEVLRTTFGEAEGKPVQRIHADAELAWVERGVEAGEVMRRVEEEAARPFDLERGPLLRVMLLKVGDEEHVLVWVVHHIVFDGWSVGLLEKELGEEYAARARGEARGSRVLEVQYADYARWQREWLKGEVLEKQLTWWKRELAGAPRVLELPTDRARPVARTYRGALKRVELPEGLEARLRERSRKEGVTLYMALLAGFQALLARYSGQEDVVVGTPISGRNWRQVEGLVGFFVNTLVMRTETGGASFQELLKRVRRGCLGAYAHQDLPFEQLVDALQPSRDLSRSPLFQVMFVMPGVMSPMRLEGLQVEDVDFEPGVSKFDLTLFAWESPRGLTTYWEYNTELFHEETVLRMAGHYGRLLSAAVEAPERRVSELPLLGEAERRALLLEWGARHDSSYAPGLMHRWVEAQVMRTPHAEAVTVGTCSLTYAELDARANQLANHLVALGVRPNGSVGLCLDRAGLEMPVAVLATLKAGAAFLPLDPTWPTERLKLMLADTEAPVVVAQSQWVSAVPAGTEARLLCLEDEAPAIALRSTRAPDVAVSPETHCYFVYTSGSTGRPKGIVMSHRAVGNMLGWLLKRTVTPKATTLQFASLNFDVSFQEMFGTWCLGGRVLLMTPALRQDPSAMLRYMVRHRVERLFLPFVALQALCDAAGSEEVLPPLTEVVTAGEQLQVTPALVSFFERLPGCVLENQYGPSEAHVVTAWRASGPPSSWPALPPVGMPITNVRLYVLDANGEPCPLGVPGEVGVAGASLAHGYHGRPDLTAERFLPDTLGATAPGERYYRTGDRARWLADGNLEFLGRLDGQVKLRGFRIELGEVEVVLRSLQGVRDAVAVVREDVPGDRRLVAYVVFQEGLRVEPSELRAQVQARVPEYMVPSAFVVLPALPLAPTGKVDRKALPVPHVESSRGGSEAPRTAMERVVAEVFGPLLGLERVGVETHFFGQGGHSLLAMQAVSRLKDVVGRELPVRILFESPTVAQLAEHLEDVLEEARGAPPPPLVSAPHGGVVAQSFAQQRLWFLSQLDAGGASYNMPFAVRLRGRLDVNALRESFREVVKRHEVLRTTFGEVEGKPVQRIHEEVALEWTVEAVEEGEVTRRVEEEAKRPFDLERGPLLRGRVLRVGKDDHVLVWVVHHIVFDGWSVGVLEKELGEAYRARVRGDEGGERALEVQYADYTRWQREWLKGEVLEKQLQWWRQALAGAPPVLELPADKPRPAMQSFNGKHLALHVPSGLASALRERSRKEGVTLYMALLAGFQALLARYSGQEDVVVGTPISGRNWRQVEGLVGFFVNTLVMRTETGGASFQELLKRVRRGCLGAYAHQDLPFEQLVDALQPSRDLSRSPLFQVMFVMPGPTTPLELSGLAVEEVVFEPGMAKFDLTLFVRERPHELVTYWEYNTDLFDEPTVARMANHYLRLLQAALTHPSLEVASLPLLGEAERHRLLVEWNATQAPCAPEPCVNVLFEAQAARTPDAVAVRFEDESLTYGELNEKANRLARHLRRGGVGPDVLVGLCVRRSLDLVVGVLGILKSGGAYVPLDPSYPRERLEWMLRSSGATALVTQSSLSALLPDTGARRLDLDTDAARFEGEDSGDLPPLAGPASLAYVIYTSGSTGAPKGVAMPHGPLLNLVRWQLGASRRPKGRTLQFSALSFDVSFQEMFSTWAAGGELVLMNEELRLDAHALLDLMDLCAVERLFLPFVALQNLAEAADRDGRVPRRLREIVTAGEQLRVTPALRRFMKRLPGGVLHNQYGPSEAHVVTALTLEGDPEAWPDLPPIGRPIANARLHVLDARQTPVPVGVPGELYVGGDVLARGYLHRPDLTLERFVADPLGTASGARLYRTGDFARYRPDGTLEFLGRRDAQVKVRGYRIELAEVEAALARHPALKDCVVEAKADSSGLSRLVAYVVGARGEPPPARELRDFLKQRLPEYMVPGHFVPLEALPLSPSGKVNRSALPAPAIEREGRASPRTALELQLVRAWEETLGLHPVGIRDDFFELGGHSLLAVRLLGRIRDLTGRTLPVASLFQGATVEHVAERLGREPGPHSTLVELRGGRTKRPFFCIHPVGGTVLAYAELAHLQERDQPFFGLQSPGLDGEAPPLDSVEALAAHHLQTIRTVQPRGPYLLGGWSMGGLLAFEMAQQLREQGDDVELLVLIDAYARPGPVDAEGLRPERLGSLFFKDLLRAAGADLPCSEDALARMPAEEALQALETAGRAAAALPEAGLSTLRSVFESNLEAAWRYVPRPYTGALLSLEAGDSPRAHEWELLARGGVEVHTLPGDHYALLRPPGVQPLARILREALARIHAGARARSASA
ncbi:non-ribosomal peptide synthetase [Myxococcus landrumensis]|uniref:Amino acid adenylation domain-containing protein n=1 Tax=Myxococcus landrumensis TaxID=2813577 RepID=A0ABX7N867_9BACT|nr:non-ribosomal peptide synthetase [Myxococcus landrumus]QSQ14838.1 amino acid adenylation domain-containing protein [Myxococcus landrumus]